MAKEKACMNCKMIHSLDKCPNCGNTQANDSFKGRMYVFDPENSEIAYRSGIKSKGEFAVKTK